jgi:predicted nucleic acid-binding Zn ribbon protein
MDNAQTSKSNLPLPMKECKICYGLFYPTSKRNTLCPNCQKNSKRLESKYNKQVNITGAKFQLGESLRENQPLTLIKQVCEWCGKPFESPYVKRSCSDYCMQKLAQETRKRTIAEQMANRKPISIRQCKGCHKDLLDYTVTDQKRVFCSNECRTKYVEVKKIKDSKLKAFIDSLPPDQKTKCITCGKWIRTSPEQPKKFCSVKCMDEYRYREREYRELENRLKTIADNSKQKQATVVTPLKPVHLCIDCACSYRDCIKMSHPHLNRYPECSVTWIDDKNHLFVLSCPQYRGKMDNSSFMLQKAIGIK